MLYLHKTPEWLKTFFPLVTWNFDRSEKKIFLTFDDGPIPELTPWVLDQLKNYNALATFFYVGDNIRKYPHLFARAVNDGHSVGNHTYNHLRGWKTPLPAYLDNVEKCEEIIESQGGRRSRKLFRPPYGQFTPTQMKHIAQSHNVVLWDYLTGDFDLKLSPEKCHVSALKKTLCGSIVVYHENIKAAPRLQYSLPLFLKHFSDKGFQFCAIE